MGEHYSSDNMGNRVPAHPHMHAPVEGTGQTVGTATAGDDLTVTLEGGKMYAVTPIGTALLAGVTGVTSTAANIEWVFPPNVTSIFQMPIDKTTLYCEGDTNSKNVYFSELKSDT
jgi:hypothetical protein